MAGGNHTGCRQADDPRPLSRPQSLHPGVSRSPSASPTRGAQPRRALIPVLSQTQSGCLSSRSLPGLSIGAKQATLNSFLKAAFPSWHFVGFYNVKEEGKLLEIGAYQGDVLAPALIPFGRGQCGAAWNSLALAVTVGFLSTLLGLAFALVIVRTSLPFKRFFKSLSLLPIITPPFVIGLAVILLLGLSGVVTQWVAATFGIAPSRWIYGFEGVLLAQLLVRPVTVRTAPERTVLLRLRISSLL